MYRDLSHRQTDLSQFLLNGGIPPFYPTVLFFKTFFQVFTVLRNALFLFLSILNSFNYSVQQFLLLFIIHCLIYISLPDQHFYSIRSLTIFYQTLLSAYTNLKYFLLLTYSCLQNSWSYHSSSKRRAIFHHQLLRPFHALVALQLAWVCTSMQVGCLTQSDLALFRGCQVSCGIVPNGPADSVISFNIHQGLNC